jgi:hypothetical protein
MASFWSVQEFLADAQVRHNFPASLYTRSLTLDASHQFQKLPAKVLFDISNSGHLEGSAEKDVSALHILEALPSAKGR